MKGHFSVEWLSQSSQITDSHQPAVPVSTAALGVPQMPSTSGTVSESLPGFYRQFRPVQGPPQEAVKENHTGFTQNGQNQEVRMNLQQCVQGQETGFSTEEEETSGYESEGGRSLSPSGMKDSAQPAVSPSSGRRPRTAFTAEQINSLEKAFKRNAYLGTQDKAELCKRLHLSDKQIRNWFQNRRMKLKRTVQDALAHACQAKVASHLMQYPELQGYRPAPYPTTHYYHPQESSAAYMTPSGLHYNPAASGHLHSLPVDALYQYSGLSTLAVAPGGTPRMVPYQAYTHQY
ncbi:ventrally expressed dharma/bozozok antagonist [Alosa alosa]|uniref:ventrally expressed dharma/bozozok antagonist n=1 Tax=Alosa alosa TaxID=278164 RepID=UPI002015395D|nr:ventrally expressed dharma/bozozok antagonist [Alosa alosa]